MKDIHDIISAACHLIGELVFGQHAETRRKDSEADGKKAEFALLRLPRVAFGTNNVTPSGAAVQFLKAC